MSRVDKFEGMPRATDLSAGPLTRVPWQAGENRAVSKDIAAIRRVGFLTLNEFTLMAFTSAIEVMRMANHLLGKNYYQWSVITPDGRPVPSSSGIAPLETVKYSAAGRVDMVLVCGGTNVTKYVDERVTGLIRRMSRDGIFLGGLCTGTYALVQAGLLDGYHCTIHWENMAGLREQYSRVEFMEELFVIDRDRITCSGGIAPIDLMLTIVRARFGKTLVAEISNQFILRTRPRQRRPAVYTNCVPDRFQSRDAAKGGRVDGGQLRGTPVGRRIGPAGRAFAASGATHVPRGAGDDADQILPAS